MHQFLGRRTGFPAAEGLLDGGLDLRGLHVAVNGDHAVVRSDQFFVERFQVADLEPGDGFLHAGGIQAVTGVAIECAAHGQAGAFEQVVLLRVNVRNLHLALAFERVGGEHRVQQHVGQQIETGGKIAAQGFQVDAETVVAAVAVNAAADGFDFRGDVPGAAVRGALEQHPAGQLGDAVVLAGFGQHAALEHGAEFDEGQAMVLLHQQAESVGQFKFPDGLVVLLLDGDGRI